MRLFILTALLGLMPGLLALSAEESKRYSVYNNPFGRVRQFTDKTITAGCINFRQFYQFYMTNGTRLIDQPLTIIKPGFQMVRCRIENVESYSSIKLKIIEGNTNGLFPGELLFFDTEYAQDNHKYLDIIRGKAGKDDAVENNVADAFAMAERSVLSRDYAKALGILSGVMALIKTSENRRELEAETLYRMSSLFNRDYEPEVSSFCMEDPVNQRELLLELVKKYPEQRKWLEKANYSLAWYYMNYYWESKNSVSYTYLTNSGLAGAIVMDYADNLLKTAGSNAVIFIDGSYSQDIALEMAKEIGGKRPDVRVYDWNGNLFDTFLQGSDHKTYYDAYSDSVAYMLDERRPPKGLQVHTVGSEREAFRKLSGPVYFSWEPLFLSNINANRLSNEQKPYILKRTGLLFEAIEKGQSSLAAIKSMDVWKSYQWSGSTNEWKELPYQTRTILGAYFADYAREALTNKQLVKAKENLLLAMSLSPEDRWLMNRVYKDYQSVFDTNYKTSTIMESITNVLEKKPNAFGLYRLLFYHLFRQVLYQPAKHVELVVFGKELLGTYEKNLQLTGDFSQYKSHYERVTNDLYRLENMYPLLDKVKLDEADKVVAKKKQDIYSVHDALEYIILWVNGYDFEPWKKKVDGYLNYLLKQKQFQSDIFMDSFYTAYYSDRFQAAYDFAQRIIREDAETAWSPKLYFRFCLGKACFELGKGPEAIENLNKFMKITETVKKFKLKDLPDRIEEAEAMLKDLGALETNR